MADLENKALVLDLVEWIAGSPRTYSDVMEAWRTSCPRLPVWEDAVELGLVVCERATNSGLMVRVTPAGWTLLQAERPSSASCR